MAKQSTSVGKLVNFYPDKGNRNPDGKQVAKGKVICDNEDGSVDIKVKNHEDEYEAYVVHGAFEGDTLGTFEFVSESKLSKEQRKEYGS